MSKIKLAFIIDDFNSSLISGLSFEHSIIYTLNKLNPKEIELFILTNSNVKDNPYESFKILSNYQSKYRLRLFSAQRKLVRFFKFLRLDYIFSFLNPIFTSILEFSVIDDTLDKNQIDLAFMVFSNHILKIPYFSVCLDLNEIAHTSLPEFGLNKKEWLEYDHFRRDFFRKSSKIFVGTNLLKNDLSLVYGIPSDKIVINKFFVPLNEIVDNVNRFKENGQKIDSQLPNNYLFYPARFMPQKNHYYLLHAISELRNSFGIRQNLVFCGFDKGNKEYIEKLINTLKLEDQIKVFDVVEYAELVTLYKNAKALIFPAINGPDNLPPLEAISLNCPALVSNLVGHQEQLGDAVIYFDPYNPPSIIDAILKLNDEKLVHELLCNGKKLIADRNVSSYTKTILQEVEEFSKVRKLWPQLYKLKSNRT
jgi:glycosyltransferase involved in cell wall biosynthesis